MFRSKIQHLCLQSPAGVFSWQVHVMNRFKTLENFTCHLEASGFLWGRHAWQAFAWKALCFVHTCPIKVLESEEVGVTLVGTGRETQGGGFTFLQAKGCFNGIV